MGQLYVGKETEYNGILFRSKNEAKWAKFSDLVRLKYEYEPITVYGINGQQYKPDFYFPDYGIYAEVKSNTTGIQNADMSVKLTSVLVDPTTPVSKGLLLLGSFPYDVRVSGVRLKTKWLRGDGDGYIGCADAYIEQRLLSRSAMIRLTEDNYDQCFGIPPSASPDIFKEKDDFGGYFTIAINETNEYFAEDK